SAACARAEDGRGLTLLDDGRALELEAGREGIAVVERGVAEAGRFGEVRFASGFDGLVYGRRGGCGIPPDCPPDSRGARQADIRCWPGDGHAPVQRLDRNSLGQPMIERAVRG